MDSPVSKKVFVDYMKKQEEINGRPYTNDEKRVAWLIWQFATTVIRHRVRYQIRQEEYERANKKLKERVKDKVKRKMDVIKERYLTGENK